jgi:hypothetical protein
VIVTHCFCLPRRQTATMRSSLRSSIFSTVTRTPSTCGASVPLSLRLESQHKEQRRANLWPTRLRERRDPGPRYARSTTRIHSGLMTHGAGRPSASVRFTSHESRRACVESGTTGTWLSDGSNSGRPSTSTGRRLSGLAKRNHRMSPRAITVSRARRRPRLARPDHSRSRRPTSTPAPRRSSEGLHRPAPARRERVFPRTVHSACHPDQSWFRERVR